MNTNRFRFRLAPLASALLVATLATGCAGMRDKVADMRDKVADKLPQARGEMNDAEVVAMLNAANVAEVGAANLALQKQLPPAVTEYAQHMRNEHRKNMAQTAQLGKQIGGSAASSKEAAKIEKRGAEVVDKLAEKDGQEFARAYVEAMVDDHQDVLSMIDKELQPAAADPALKKHLDVTRMHVEQHLRQARALQQQL